MHSLPVSPIIIAIVVFLFLLAAAVVIEVFVGKKYIAYSPAEQIRPIAFVADYDFWEWWTPSELEYYAELENKKMTTPVGRHLVEAIEKISISSIPEQDLNNQEGDKANDIESNNHSS